MSDDKKKLLTIGDMCRETGEPAHRVKYAIASYRIEPIQRAGCIRLFDRDQAQRIISAMARIGRGGAR